jgi:PBSX family phage terminase large subunit
MNEGVFEFTLLPAQKWMLELPDGFTGGHDVAFLQGGYGSGKTLPGAFGCLLLCQELCEIVDGLTGLVCAPSYAMLRDATVPTYQKLLNDFGLEEGVDYTYNRSNVRMTFHCWNDAVLMFKSLDNPQSIRSINASFAHVDEGSLLKTRGHLLEVIGRVRQGNLPVHRIFITSNPEARRGWMAELFDTPFKITSVTDPRNGEKVQVCFRKRRASTIENPHIGYSFIETLRQSMDEDMFRVFVLGEDCNLTRGLVVNNFTENNIRELKHREELPLHVTCDFNFDPCCWVFVQRVNGEFHAFDELCLEKTDVDEMCRALIEKFPKDKIKHGIIINGDASAGFNHVGVTVEDKAKDERNSLYTKMLNTLRKEYGHDNVRVATNKGNPAISRRIESFKAKVCNANGEMYVYLDPRCKQTIKCIQNLRYKEGCNDYDLPSPAQIARDPSQKWFSDHAFDALSCMVDYYEPLKIDVIKKKAFVQKELYFSI